MQIINIFDKTIIEFAHSLHNNYQILDLFFSSITYLGESIPLIVFTIILIFIKRTRVCGINMAVSLFISILIGAIILKPLIARERPFTDPIYNEYWIAVGKHIETSFSCPSSHTTASFYLVVHYPSDVVFGAFIGITVSCLTYFIFKRLNIEYRLNQIPIINKFDNP